ncbi:9573_t:CDS:2 [Acaulospora colombiana]|uniref:9573_t:CDS:1 n=1 Tax=Acaulospora colombiana TaxID=27376 RepID=A0ACA9K3U4_9GLOM|nr:9573_t:CDS:2 [Acaulospora colombiana]
MSMQVESAENFSNDEASSSEDSTEIYQVGSLESNDVTNKKIDQSSLLHEIIKCTFGNYSAPLTQDIKMPGVRWNIDDGVGKSIESNENTSLISKNEYFDYIYLRYTMITVRRDKFDFLLRELTRVLKRGGWIEFTEPGHEIRSKGPTNAVLEEVWHRKAREENLRVEEICNLGKVLSENGYIDVREKSHDIPLGEYGGKTGIDTANHWKAWMQMHQDLFTEATAHKSKHEFDEFIERCFKEFNDNHSCFVVYNFVAQKA